MNQAIKISMKIICSDNTQQVLTFKNLETINNIIYVLKIHTINGNVITYLNDLENCIHCQGYSDTKCYKCSRIVCSKCYEINSHV